MNSAYSGQVLPSNAGKVQMRLAEGRGLDSPTGQDDSESGSKPAAAIRSRASSHGLPAIHKPAATAGLSAGAGVSASSLGDVPKGEGTRRDGMMDPASP